jgi:hypothetical protein
VEHGLLIDQREVAIGELRPVVVVADGAVVHAVTTAVEEPLRRTPTGGRWRKGASRVGRDAPAWFEPEDRSGSERSLARRQ